MGNTSKLLILILPNTIQHIFVTKTWFYIIWFSHFHATVCAVFSFFSNLVCVLGEPRSQPCPRTPEPFRTPGPDGNKHPPSVWFIDHSPPDLTHTQTHLKKHHIWVHMKALLLTVEDEKFTWKNAARAPTKKKKKMRSGKCVHRN